MKRRFHALSPVQKVIVVVMAVAIVIFAVIYAVNASRIGLAYGNGFLTHFQDGETRSYTGRSDWAELTFTVRGNTVTSQWGGETHIYTVKEDPAAISESLRGHALGVEVWEGEERLFRGGWVPGNGWRYDENGKLIIAGIVTVTATSSDGTDMDDPPQRAPGVSTILSLWHGPKLTPRVEGGYYFAGLFLALLAAGALLFGDDLFRLQLSFRVKDPDAVEPSDWELISRTFGGAVMAVLALVLWILPFC